MRPTSNREEFPSTLSSTQDRARVTAALENVMESLSSPKCREALKGLLESFCHLGQFLEETVAFAILLEQVGNITFSFEE